jgi:hypothetical protein
MLMRRETASLYSRIERIVHESAAKRQDFLADHISRVAGPLRCGLAPNERIPYTGRATWRAGIRPQEPEGRPSADAPLAMYRDNGCFPDGGPRCTVCDIRQAIGVLATGTPARDPMR